jgi:uncharacterized protein
MIDGLAIHDYRFDLDLGTHLPEAYRELIERSRDSARRIRARWLYDNPKPPTTVSTTDYDAIVGELLSRGTERIVLGYEDALLVSGYQGRNASRAVISAVNDWTVSEWLAKDERLYGLILIPTGTPEDAGEEIRRMGRNPRMVGVALGINALGRMFGEPVYHPIYRAAAEMGLPIVLQTVCDGATDQAGPPVAGGSPMTFAEYRALNGQALMSHVGSMILESVFDRFPTLQVLLVGGGATWIPGFLWRLDYWYRITPSDAPGLARLPSEYFTRHFFMSTYGLEAPPGNGLVKALDTHPGLLSRLLYTSCWPNEDSTKTKDALVGLPAELATQILRDNALALYRWPDQAPSFSREPAQLATARPGG